MKIAIPTADGVTISRNFSAATEYLVSTIQLGEITGQEMRINPAETGVLAGNCEYENLEDCEKVMVREIEPEPMDYLKNHKKEIIQTREELITKALIQFLEVSLHEETNTCCCP